MEKSKNFIKTSFAKIRSKVAVLQARKRERLAIFKERQETLEKSMNHVCELISEGEFVNADKISRNLSFSDKEMKRIAKKALVIAIRNKNDALAIRIVRKHHINDNDLYFSAVDAHEGSMNDKYYEDAIEIARKYRLMGYEIDPAILLIQKNLRFGLREEAIKVAREHGLEKQLEEAIMKD